MEVIVSLLLNLESLRFWLHVFLDMKCNLQMILKAYSI